VCAHAQAARPAHPTTKEDSVLQLLAYLDPGSGSMIIQILVGGLAAVGVTMKLYWRRITGIFSRGKKVEEKS
jgi:hypothetical protein